MEQTKEELGRDAAKPSSTEANQAPAANPLSDEQLQDKYRKEYIEQLKRRSCPGCGEDFPLF